MPQYVFDIKQVYRKKPEDKIGSLVAEVDIEVIDQHSGRILHKMVVPVLFHNYGVYPELSNISSHIPSPNLRKEVYYRVRRYVKRLRPYLEVSKNWGEEREQ
ncbi:hypothetical protein ACFPU1_16380 [Thalassorhabdus alkalitolerans]|uniref:Uncharacterized protein n=1 Tax=Thalassorhabdus alkalitolerans TaxID=2282697 RepID=A0ABW0YVE0_9BACI